MTNLLDASKPPEGAGVVVAGSAAGTAAGTGGVGDGSELRPSKLDANRSLEAKGARA